METHYQRGYHPNSKKAQFKRGIPGPWFGKKRLDMRGENHPLYRGPKPWCWCGKQLSRFDAKNCRLHSEFSIGRIEKIKAGAMKRKGANHLAWQGETVKYRPLHAWVERELGKPSKCEHCKVRGFSAHEIHWANKSRKYLRIKSDWIRLCAKCHGIYDRKSKPV